MEASPEQPDELAPAQLITPAQRRCLLEWGRSGSVDVAAARLGLSPQTVKNHMADAYRRLGVHSGGQALYLVMGGDRAADDLPPPVATGQRPPPPAREMRMPVMVDKELSIAQLTAAARVGDAEADGSPRASLTECIEFLAYYIHPAGWTERLASTRRLEAG